MSKLSVKSDKGISGVKMLFWVVAQLLERLTHRHTAVTALISSAYSQGTPVCLMRPACVESCLLYTAYICTVYFILHKVGKLRGQGEIRLSRGGVGYHTHAKIGEAKGLVTVYIR